MALSTTLGLVFGALAGWGLAHALFERWTSRTLAAAVVASVCAALADPAVTFVNAAVLDDLLIWGVAALAGSIGLLAVVNVLDMVFEADAEAG